MEYLDRKLSDTAIYIMLGCFYIIMIGLSITLYGLLVIGVLMGIFAG